jgi:predicted PurR-regulated permease PerM
MRRTGGYAWRLLAIGLVLAGAVVIISPLQTVLMSLFFALPVAAWLMPPTNLLDRWMPRWLAAVISVDAFTVVVLAVFAFIGLSAASQWDDIWKSVESGVADLNTWMRQGPLGPSDADILGYYQSVVGFVQSSSGGIALGVLGGLGNIVSVATALAAGLFVLVFVLVQPQRMYGWLTGWLPARNREVTSTAGLIAWNAFSQ